QAHVPCEIQCYLFYLIASFCRKPMQEGNDGVRVRTLDDGHQSAFLSFGSLIGYNRVKFSVG
ncbi:MAG TPA: hypothetical protein PKG48_10825, partial [Bacteroidales bacterium]|nr:hypothetical protein [Bacteroidales bacterium]HPS61585.1 hypothetical protein [Bacteroidales bacterium]